MSDLRTFGSYAEAASGFTWDIPSRYNAVSEVASHRDRPRAAVRSAAADGTVDGATFGELTERAGRLAATLAELGAGHGTDVAIMLPSTVACAVAELAVLWTGATVAPLRDHPEDDALRHELALVRPAIVICPGEQVDRLRAALAPRDAIFLTAGAPHPSAATSVEAALARDVAAPPIAETAPDDPAIIAFTSGSTGAPKAVVMPHRSIIGMRPTFQMITSAGPADDEVVFNSLGWATPAGLRPIVMPAWHFGCTVVAPERPPDLAGYCEVITSERVTFAYLMPNVLRELRQLGDAIGDYDWSALRTITYAGEAIGPTLHAWLEESLGAQVNGYYGATEVGLPAATNAKWFATPVGSIGRRVPGRGLAVLDEHALTPVPAGHAGILSVDRTDPTVFLGYRGLDSDELGVPDDAATATHFMTNDIGTVDADGLVTFIGRRGQVLYGRGGAGIPPTDVEDLALGCDGVREAAALQIDDALVVGVTPADGADAAAIAPAVAAAIAARFGDDLPLTRLIALDAMPTTVGTRKVNREALRRLIREHRDTLVAVEIADPA